MYIRDLDPKFNPNDNSDLLIERGSSDIARSFGISMDSYWEPKFSFKSENEQEGDDFFINHLELQLIIQMYQVLI